MDGPFAGSTFKLDLKNQRFLTRFLNLLKPWPVTNQATPRRGEIAVRGPSLGDAAVTGRSHSHHHMSIGWLMNVDE